MVTRRVERFATDGALIAGGARAILLQVADPVIGAGVARHSDFAHRPLDRLRNTLSYVYAVVLGTADDAARVIRHVTDVHAPVEGAMDASRQLWVAATLYDTAVVVHERLHGAIDDEFAGELLAEYRVLGTALQVGEAHWPTSRAAFADYWSSTLETLEVSADAKRIAHDLFAPVVAPIWLRASLPLARLLTIDLLPERLRAAYGFHWDARRRQRASLAWAVLRALVRVTPYRLRSWPARHYLGLLRRTPR